MTMAVRTVPILAFVTFLQIGCGRPMSPGDFIHMIENDRGSVLSIERNGTVAKLKPLPREYFAAKMMMFDPAITFPEAMEKTGDGMTFVLTVKPNEKRKSMISVNNSSFRGHLMNNTFGRERDVFLCKGRDTLYASNVVYERNWGLTTDDVFTITFDSGCNMKLSMFVFRNLDPYAGTIEIPVTMPNKKPISIRNDS